MASDRLTDSLDRHWLAGAPLGRGTWGRSRAVRDAQGREAVLKEPLVEADFQPDVPIPDDTIAACRNAARQQSELLHEADRPCLPRLEATVELGGGRVGLVLPRYDTLEQRLIDGVTLGETLQLAHRVASVLAEASLVHGNLRPSNVMFDERGDLILADSATSALVGHQARLVAQADASAWLPPEARHRPTAHRAAAPGPLWDTWALCQLVHVSILAEDRAAGEDPAPLRLTLGGLDKVALASLKDAAHARLAAEGSNPRFRSRVTDRLGALLARGLSTEFEPSPPYRFATARDLAERLNEVLALLRPRVSEVGKILLPAIAPDGVFTGRAGERSGVSFSVTVGCTLGISDHEDLVCGLQLVDLDAPDERKAIDDAELAVQVHPSGRLRFQIALPDVEPGRYRVRVAFAVKDSGEEPLVAVGEFEVRPPPGYVPPRKEPAGPSALPFASGPVAATAAKPGPSVRAATPAAPEPRAAVRGDPGVVVDLFPRPVAPPAGEGDPLDAPLVADSAPSADEATPPTVLRTRTPASPPEAAPPPALKPAQSPRLSEPRSAEPRTAPDGWGTPPPLQPLSSLPRHDEGTDSLDTQELLNDAATPPTVRRTVSPDLHRAPREVREPPSSPFGSRPPVDPTPIPDPELPGTGVDDLAPPDAERPRPPGPFAAVVELVRRDPYVAVGTAVATSLVLVLVTTALLENC